VIHCGFQNCLSEEQFEKYLKMVAQIGRTAARSKKLPLEWSSLVVRAKRLEKCIHTKRGFSAMPFTYTEGVVAEAARLGQWLLSKLAMVVRCLDGNYWSLLQSTS
jgi:hypothetical protein